MILNRAMAEAILRTFEDPEIVETIEGEAQIRVTCSTSDGSVCACPVNRRVPVRSIGRARTPY